MTARIAAPMQLDRGPEHPFTIRASAHVVRPGSQTLIPACWCGKGEDEHETTTNIGETK